MEFKNLIVEIEEKIGIIKINRPQKLNAIDPETLREFESAIKKLNENEEVRVLIITGEGKAFVSGSDISELSKMNPMEARAYSEMGHRILYYIENMEKPVIAAINGFALGTGCEIALACDIRIASTNAKFGQPEVKLGIIPGHGGTQRLAKIVGMGKAKELVLTGDIIDANTALSIGLVSKVVEQEKLIEEAKNLAKKLISVGKNAVKLAKSAINKSFTDIGIQYEQEVFGLCFSTDEAREGMQAFIEKRKPNW